MRHIIFTILILCFFTVNTWTHLCAQAVTNQGTGSLTVLSDDIQSIWIEKGVSYFFESTPLTHIQVEQLEPSVWKPSRLKIPNLGANKAPVWLKFDLLNQAAANIDWLMEIKWGYLDRIELFLFNRSTRKWQSPMQSGNLVPMAKRVMAYPTYLFPLVFQPDEQVSVYLRVSSTSKYIIPIKVWQKNAFKKSLYNQLMLSGIYFGILTVMVLYNFLLYISTRDKSFLYFSLFVFTLILYTLMPSGIGAFYIWDNAIWIKTHAYGLFSSLSFLTAAIFIRRYLSLTQYGGWILRINSFFIGYWFYSMLIYCFISPPFFILLEDLMGILGTIAAMATGIYAWIKKDVSARFFVIAWTFLAIGTILLILSSSGLTERTWITTYSQSISFAIVVMLLSFALPERINRERAIRAKAQKEALVLSRKVADERAAKLEAQAHLLELQRQTSEELELRVKNRSAQLEAAMERLGTTNEELSHLNITDSLTKVHNRRYFDQMMAEEVRRAYRNGQSLAVIMADIDQFKSVNDTFGHLIGDECLHLVAQTIQQLVNRESYLVARYGGEEFALILPMTAAETALTLADQIRIAVQNLTFSHRGRQIELRISLGVAVWIPRLDEAPERLIQTADKALYLAKQKGRNRVVLCETDLAV